jgi:hypothetical protein
MKKRKNEKRERVEGNLELALEVVVENSEALKKEQMKKWILNQTVIKNEKKKGWLH